MCDEDNARATLVVNRLDRDRGFRHPKVGYVVI